MGEAAYLFLLMRSVLGLAGAPSSAQGVLGRWDCTILRCRERRARLLPPNPFQHCP